MAIIAATVAVAGPGCSLFDWLYPPETADAPQTVFARGAYPDRGADVVVDDEGVPHIFAQDEPDAAYGLGFVHARDRLFQIDFLRHAAQGRITELFGRDFLDTDSQLRFMTYRLRDEERLLSPRLRRILEAYVQGVNDGASHAGLPAELRLLRLTFKPFSVYDALSIFRLYSFRLSGDLDQEFVRARVLARLAPDDPRRDALLVPLDDGGVAHLRDLDEPDAPDPAPLRPEGLSPLTPPTPLPPPPAPPTEGRRLDQLFPKGASNAWAVSGAHTNDGHPVLCADPHLRHAAPSTVYLAHIAYGPVDVVGATFPGVPAVVAGHNRTVSFAFTASYADTQDLVRIQTDPDRDDRYIVDDEAKPFGAWMQSFVVNGQIETSEVWKTTLFGPMLPEAYRNQMEPDAQFALLWPGFFPDEAKDSLLAFWDLAAAGTVDEARTAVGGLAVPSLNWIFADTRGDIAYALSGRIPLRISDERSDRPRNGAHETAGWRGFLPEDALPYIKNPPTGYVFSANQRIDEDDRIAAAYGFGGRTPHRAQRIDHKLRDLVRHKHNEAVYCGLQQDVTSPQAQRLAPVLGTYCPEALVGHNEGRVSKFCEYVRTFDGAYTTESLGALPFTWLLEAFTYEVLAVHVGEDFALYLQDDPATQMIIENAILEEHQGRDQVLFDDYRSKDREGLAGFVERAAAVALDRLVEEVSAGPQDWRWGSVHRLTFKNALASTPVVGAVFQVAEQEESGWSTTIRAEGGLPVDRGAVFRLMAHMTSPVEGRMVIDLGQSGHYQHPHFSNQRERWRVGETFVVPTDRAAIPVHAELRLRRPLADEAGEKGPGNSG